MKNPRTRKTTTLIQGTGSKSRGHLVMNMPSLYDSYYGGAEPGEGGGIAGGENGPSPATRLVLDGYDRGQTGEIEEDEDEIGIGGLRRHTVGLHHLTHVGVLAVVIAKRVVVGIEHADGAGHYLLGTDTSQEADIEFPVESLHGEDGFDGLTHPADIRLLLLLLT